MDSREFKRALNEYEFSQSGCFIIGFYYLCFCGLSGFYSTHLFEYYGISHPSGWGLLVACFVFILFSGILYSFPKITLGIGFTLLSIGIAILAYSFGSAYGLPFGIVFFLVVTFINLGLHFAAFESILNS